MNRGRSTPLLPNITVQQLEYLVAAADHSTHAEAAAALGVSASALSQGLAELGRRLGIALFERVGRAVALRDEAEPVLAHARMVVAQTASLASYTRAAGQGRAGRVRVGMIDVAAVHHLAPALHSIRSESPDIDLHLTVAPSSQLLMQLQAGTLDIAVAVRPRVLDPALEALDIIEEPLHVYVGNVQRPKAIHPQDPSTWGPWVGFPSASHSRQVIGSALRAAGATYDVVAESNQPDVLKEMASLGLGLVVLPAVQAEDEPRPLTRLVPKPITHRSLCVVIRKEATPTAVAADVYARLTE